MTKRLTVDMVLKAYEETGMQPASGTFYEEFMLGYEDGQAARRAVEEKYEKVYEM